MDTPSFKEGHISQIPALKMPVNLEYTYLSPTETDRQRGGKTSNVEKWKKKLEKLLA